MKSLLFGVFTLLSIMAVGQVTDTDLNEVWNDNIQSIIHMDKEKIVEQTQFPLEGGWAFMVDSREPTIDDYRSGLEVLFPEELREELKGLDHSVLSINEEVISYSFYQTFQEGEDTFESMTIYTFSKVDGVWKLTSITIAG